MKLGIGTCLALLATMPVRSSAQIPVDAQQLAFPLFGSTLTVNGPPQDQECSAIPDGIRVLVKNAGKTPFTVQVQTDHNHLPVRVGDVVFITFEARSTTEGGGIWQMYAQNYNPPWDGYFGAQGAPGAEWRRVNVNWTANKDVRAGSMELTFHIASQAQELEFRGFTAVDLGPYKGALPFTRITYAGQEPGAAWRKQAETKIDRYRKANLTVRVTDQNGHPAAGAKVHIRQLRHAYEFGSFVEDPLLWNNADGDRYRQWFLKAYNKATTPMYWADWGWEDPAVHAQYMKYPQWLKDHSIVTKAHVLIYPGWGFMPSRIKKLEHDPAALWKEIEKHLREKMALTKPFGFVSWDSINETRDQTDLVRVFGSEDVYVKIYQLAHKLDPSPTLFINENTIESQGGKTGAEQTEYERMIRSLLDHGAPLQGIGMQGHFGEVLTPPTEIWHILDRFAKFGLPIQMTEFDLPIQDPQAQADYTRDLLTAWFAHPATTGFTMWGFWEGSMWKPEAALIDKNWHVRPNGQAWLDLVKKRWWTDTTAVADAEGRVTARVFKGDYEISSGKSEKDVTVLERSNLTIRR